MKKILPLLFVGFIGLAFTAQGEQKLWYDTPAKEWTEALPLGNSRIGAMVYGDPAREQIQLNEG